ncbi:MAG: immune inhibitor A [Chloroflexi bacterium]|nr:immune inhibitor A [Chloroflexota bacterium]
MPDRDLHALAERLGGLPKGSHRTLQVANADQQAGHRQEFFVTDITTDTTYVIDATLQVVSPNAYWYVDDDLRVPDEGLQLAASEYESSIRPRLLEAFGDVWNPGVDGDPRLTILHTDLGGGVAGYFDSRHEFPRHTHPHSNEREMLFMDGVAFRPGSPDYMKVLAHELQHAIHWAHDPGEDSWVNEGLSEVATKLVGYSPSFIEAFLNRPSTQLTFWEELGGSIPHYGAATLFMLYLLEHYGDSGSLSELIANPADGVEGINAFLQPHGKTFDDVYADWIAANFLDSETGPFGYSEHRVQVTRVDEIEEPGETTGYLAPYSSRYFDLSSLSGDIEIEFQGDATTLQVSTGCYSGERCWWGNRGDSIDTTLTREFDLSNLSKATLEFKVWFDIEEDWDYAYVEVSTDGGETWTILEGNHTTDENPVGNSYGHGYTGNSNGWLDERVDLTPFVGSKVLIRFEYITDDAVYEDGFAIDDLAIPDLEFIDGSEDDDGGWNAQGFERIDNIVPVNYVVLVMERRSDGADIVRRMEIDEERRGVVTVKGLGDETQDAVVVVSPLARNTHQLSQFTLTVRESS